MDGKSNGLELMEPASPEALLPAYGLWPWPAGILIAALVIGLILYLRHRKPAGYRGPYAPRRQDLSR